VAVEDAVGEVIEGAIENGVVEGSRVHKFHVRPLPINSEENGLRPAQLRCCTVCP